MATTFRIEETPGSDGGLSGREVVIIVEFESDGIRHREDVQYIRGNRHNSLWDEELRKLNCSSAFIEKVRAELGNRPR